LARAAQRRSWRQRDGEGGIADHVEQILKMVKWADHFVDSNNMVKLCGNPGQLAKSPQGQLVRFP
jgi:hypothetical protein